MTSLTRIAYRSGVRRQGSRGPFVEPVEQERLHPEHTERGEIGVRRARSGLHRERSGTADRLDRRAASSLARPRKTDARGAAKLAPGMALGFRSATSAISTRWSGSRSGTRRSSRRGRHRRSPTAESERRRATAAVRTSHEDIRACPQVAQLRRRARVTPSAPSCDARRALLALSCVASVPPVGSVWWPRCEDSLSDVRRCETLDRLLDLAHAATQVTHDLRLARAAEQQHEHRDVDDGSPTDRLSHRTVGA